MPKWKACGNPKCTTKVRELHAFCKGCIRELPSVIRGRFFAANKLGSGVDYLDAKRVAVDYFKRKAQEKEKEERPMTTGKSDIIDITLEQRRDAPSGMAIAFWAGETEEDRDGNFKEVWIWLPKSQIEIETTDKKGVVEVSMPEWLALEKGLI